MADDEERLENQSADDGAPATVNMMANGGADYQAQVDAVEEQQSRGQEIIARNRAQVEERRRARYEQQDNTNAFDKKEIESERKDLTYGRRSPTPEFMGGGGITTFNGIQYPKPEDTKREAAVPRIEGDNYAAPKRTPPAYNPGSYSILGKNYIGGENVKSSQKQRATVQKDASAFIKTPEYTSLLVKHKENALQQGSVLDFMNPSPEKISSVRNAGVYNPYSGKSEQPNKRIKENPESYSILGSKYFSQDKSGNTQRKKVQQNAESFQGTTQFTNRLGMIFKEVGSARTEREAHEALVAKANAKQNTKVGTDSLSQYIPKMGVSGGISYQIPQTFSPKRKDETKYEGGTVGVPVKDRKTGKVLGLRAPASEKFENPPLKKELFKEVDSNKIRHFTKKGNEFNKSQYENYYDKLVGSGKASYPKSKQAAYELRKQQANIEANESISKKISHPQVKYTDMIVEAGLASYVKPKDYKAHETRKIVREEERSRKMSAEVKRLQREERDELERKDKLREANISSALGLVESLENLSGKQKAKEQKFLTQHKKEKFEAEQKRLKNYIAQVKYNTGVFEKEIETKKKEEEKRKKDNPKWLDKRAATISRNAENKTLREKTYGNKTPILNQITDVIGGSKGKNPYNYRKGAGEGGVFDKKVEQPVFDAQGNEIGKVVKKVNTVEEFGKKHPILASFGSQVKRDVRRPVDDLVAGRNARARQLEANRGFLYGGGLSPVNITQANPEGEFPKKSGRPTAPRRKDPVGGRELAFFGKPFGAPKAPRRTRRGKVVKMTAAERKRISRKPKSFLDSVFGAKW